MFAFGYLFGFVGLLLAVPIAAAIAVLVPLRAQALSREPDLFRRAADLTATPPQTAPRQLTLALASHREPGARGFSGRPLQRRGADADRCLARLAEPRGGAGGAGRRRQEPSRGDLGAGGGRPPRRRPLARARASCRPRWPPARWWSRTSCRAASTSGRCFICSIWRARTRPSCCSPRERHPPAGRCRSATSPRGSRRCRW